MKRCNQFIFALILIIILICGSIFSVGAATSEPTVPISTPSEVGQTPSPDIDGENATEGVSTEAVITEVPDSNITPAPTYYDKGDVELFSGEPEGTGNSAGEIIFMLVIFLGCLFLVVEAIVSFIRKKGAK